MLSRLKAPTKVWLTSNYDVEWSGSNPNPGFNQSKEMEAGCLGLYESEGEFLIFRILNVTDVVSQSPW